MTTTTLPDFDPAAVTEELLPSLTGPRLREILAYYRMPAPQRSATKHDLIAWATIVIRAAQPVTPDDPGPDPDEPSMALEPVPHGIIPEASRWQQIVAMSEYLARARLVPRALQGQPHDVAVVLLGANDLGIPLIQALNKLIVIDGKLSMAAELMVALVLRDGHSIKPDPANNATHATAHCRRAGETEIVTVTYTLEEAVTAGLVQVRDGNAYSRSRDGKPLPWEKYPADLLWARCVSRACRRVFPDALAGVSYTPEELGYVDAVEDDTPKYGKAGETEPTMTLNQQRSDIAARIQNLDDALRKELGEWWKRRNLPRAADLSPAAVGTVLAVLSGFEDRQTARNTDPDIDDAETLEDRGDVTGGTEPALSLPVTPALLCVGCNKEITGAQALEADPDEPMHFDCRPF